MVAAWVVLAIVATAANVANAQPLETITDGDLAGFELNTLYDMNSISQYVVPFSPQLAAQATDMSGNPNGFDLTVQTDSNNVRLVSPWAATAGRVCADIQTAQNTLDGALGTVFGFFMISGLAERAPTDPPRETNWDEIDFEFLHRDQSQIWINNYQNGASEPMPPAGFGGFNSLPRATNDGFTRYCIDWDYVIPERRVIWEIDGVTRFTRLVSDQTCRPLRMTFAHFVGSEEFGGRSFTLENAIVQVRNVAFSLRSIESNCVIP